ncbi:hypothetical protein J6590_050351 [Homalodisca vitripennis]|nr:hypothetical protein J6590_050351 [Homalodisca vitripennis]
MKEKSSPIEHTWHNHNHMHNHGVSDSLLIQWPVLELYWSETERKKIQEQKSPKQKYPEIRDKRGLDLELGTRQKKDSPHTDMVYRLTGPYADEDQCVVHNEMS